MEKNKIIQHEKSFHSGLNSESELLSIRDIYLHKTGKSTAALTGLEKCNLKGEFGRHKINDTEVRVLRMWNVTISTIIIKIFKIFSLELLKCLMFYIR